MMAASAPIKGSRQAALLRLADDWLSVKRACAEFEISKKTFRNWCRDGLEHSRLPSGMIRVRRSAIDAYLLRYAVGGPSPAAVAEATAALRKRGIGAS